MSTHNGIGLSNSNGTVSEYGVNTSQDTHNAIGMTNTDGSVEIYANAASLGKQNSYIIPASESVSITGISGSTETVSLIVIGDGVLSVSSSDSTKATASISNDIVTITGVASGSATITVTMADSDTYEGTTAEIDVTCDTFTITIGNTYSFGGFKWIAAEMIGIDGVVLQSQGMSSGSWPAYKLITDCTGTKNYGSANTAYRANIDGDNIANYDDVISTWYAKYSAVEKTGASYGSGLFLVSKEKCGVTGDSATTGSGVYLDALKIAAPAWLGTYGTESYAWAAVTDGGWVSQGYAQYGDFNIAPAFNLDLTKVKLVGTNHDHIVLLDESMPSLVSWTNGTDEQLKAMEEAYYNGIITLDDVKSVWSVGDARTVSLSAMAATGVGESHRAQNVQWQILGFNHDTLTTPINGKRKTLITFDQKACLMSDGIDDTNGQSNTEGGYMNSIESNDGGWNSSARRLWCNTVYYNAIPSVLKSMIKAVQKANNVGGGTSGAGSETSDFIWLVSEGEITGSAGNANPVEGTQYEFYANATSNRYKSPHYNSSYPSAYWRMRSPSASNGGHFVCIARDGNFYGDRAQKTFAIAPAGCI